MDSPRPLPLRHLPPPAPRQPLPQPRRPLGSLGSLGPLVPLGPASHVVGLGRRILAWPVTTQHGARRNAMLATLEIQHRCREQRRVEAYLDSLPPRRPAASR